MQYNGMHGQQNLELYYSGMPRPGTSMLPMPLNHGACDHFPPSNFYVGGFIVDSDNSGRGRHLVEDVQCPYKRKVEGSAGTFQYYNTSASSSSSVAPQHLRHPDGMAIMDTASFSLPQYGGGSSVSPMEVGSHSNVWARPGDPFILPDNNHFMQGNYLGQCLQPTPGTWFDQQLSSHNDIDGLNAAWNNFPVPYIQANNPNRSSLESGNVCLPRYHETIINSAGGPRFLTPPPPPPPINPNFHHGYHMHGGRVQNVNFHPHVVSSLYGNPMYGSTVIPAQNGFEMGPQQLGAQQLRPVPSGGVRIYHPQTNGVVPETHVGHRNVAHLRLLPSEEVATLELQGNDEDGQLVDHHSDMRLDIDHMSYEELLALGEWIGNVNTGMSEKTILSRLKTKNYLAPAAAAINLEEAANDDRQPDSCIICQEEYKNGEKIGVLECGHQYHVNCLKKWLLVKNVCPICKSEALNNGKKDRHHK